MSEILKQIPLDQVARSLVISLLGLLAALISNWAVSLEPGSSALVAVLAAFAVAVSNEFRKASARVSEDRSKE